MKRLLATLLLVACMINAHGQNASVVTQNVLALSGSASPLTVYREFDVRLRVFAFRGATPVSLTNTYATWRWYDMRDSTLVREEDVVIVTNYPAELLGYVRLDDLEPGAYQARMSAWDASTSNLVTDLALNNVTLTDWCDGCVEGGGGGSSTITQLLYLTIGGSTTTVEATCSPVNNVTNTLTISIGGVTNTVYVGDVYVYNTNIVEMVNNIGAVIVTNVMGGPITSPDGSIGIVGNWIDGYQITNTGGRLGAVYNATGTLVAAGATSIQFGADFDVSESGGALLLGLASSVFPSNYIGTNLAQFSYTGGEQIWEPPSGYDGLPIAFHGIGAGGAGVTGGGGGGGQFDYAVTHREWRRYMWRIGRGGQAVTNTAPGSYTWTESAYPAGGRGVTRTNTLAYGGGGRVDLLAIDGSVTTLLAVAGGGGCVAAAGAGTGGGVSGGDGGGTAGYFGYGGTQSTGGASPSVAVIVTNSSGAAFAGGDGGIALTTTIGAGLGGGDGYFGGGGSVGTASTSSGSGGGSGWINTTYADYLIGVTYRATAATPVGTDQSWYIAGRGVGGSTTTHGSRAGDAMGAAEY